MENSIFVKSDYHPLKKVLVHSLGKEIRHVLPNFEFVGLPGFSSDIPINTSIKQHEVFVNILKEKGVEVLNSRDLINNALENLRKNETLENWIKENFPNLSHLIKDTIPIDAEDLIGASDRSFYNFSKNNLYPFTSPLPTMYYTRDWGIVLDKGFILSSFGNKRSKETAIARLIFENTDYLKEIPIILDCEKEGIRLQGGDVIVLDENTLFMGIGNMTEAKAAEVISKKLNKTVIGVSMPDKIKLLKKGTPLNSIFLHLDTVFNLLSENKALVIPYFFQNDFSKNNPMKSVLNGALLKLSKVSPRYFYLKEIIKKIDGIGEVTIFKAGTGNQIKTSLKLVNFLEKEHSFKFVFMGGEMPLTQEQRVAHMVEKVMPENRFQGANIVAIKENEVLMYKENTEETQKGLDKNGVKVITFEGNGLVAWNGGPHCMTLPIERS